MRPSDWSPLADDDPVPGDPVTVRELGNHLLEVAGTIRAQTGRMADLDAGEIWDSDAAVTFTEMQEKLPPDLETAATRYEGVGNAMLTYETALSGAQADADAALRRAQEAQADLEAANRGIDDMADWEDQAETTANETNEANPDMPEVEPEPWSGPDHYALRDDANGRIEQARSDLDSAIEARDDAAGTAEGTIEEASDDDIADPGFWESALLAAADVLAIAGAVLGVLSIVFPVLAPLALAVGVASLLLNTGLAAAGSKSWDDAMWDAIGVATFGVGRVVGLGARVVRASGARGAINAASSRAFSNTMSRVALTGQRSTASSRLASLRGQRGALWNRSSLTGLRATNANGTTLYGAAARSRLTSQLDDGIASQRQVVQGLDDQIDSVTDARRVAHADRAAARDQYDALRHPSQTPWRQSTEGLSPNRPGLTNGLAFTGDVIETGGGLVVGSRNTYVAANNMATGQHWGHAPAG